MAKKKKTVGPLAYVLTLLAFIAVIALGFVLVDHLNERFFNQEIPDFSSRINK